MGKDGKILYKASGIKPGLLVNGVRVAVTGQAKGPEFMKVLAVLGRLRVTERLRRVEAVCRAAPAPLQP